MIRNIKLEILILLVCRDCANFLKSNFGMCLFWIPETGYFDARVKNCLSEFCLEFSTLVITKA